MYTYNFAYKIIETLNNLNILGEVFYSRFPKSCVDNHNLIKYTNKNVAECKELCSQNNKCVAFEYGVAYRDGGTYNSRDCTLSDSVEKDGCPGFYHNLDLYVKGNYYNPAGICQVTASHFTYGLIRIQTLTNIITYFCFQKKQPQLMPSQVSTIFCFI